MKFEGNLNKYIGTIIQYYDVEFRLITAWEKSMASVDLFWINPTGGTFGIVVAYKSNGSWHTKINKEYHIAKPDRDSMRGFIAQVFGNKVYWGKNR